MSLLKSVINQKYITLVEGDMMKKTILITGSTDGIGFETARMLLAQGHYILLHGRSIDKLEKTEKKLKSEGAHNGEITCYVSDLSNMADVELFAETVIANHKKIDVLINNAGVFKSAENENCGWSRYSLCGKYVSSLFADSTFVTFVRDKR